MFLQKYAVGPYLIILRYVATLVTLGNMDLKSHFLKFFIKALKFAQRGFWGILNEIQSIFIFNFWDLTFLLRHKVEAKMTISEYRNE